ncbi:amidase [Microbacterium pseudoresistens]|uniref:Amidase n=1 Tax=Microbacterium pseudoresistens TaxID=640634 RepID=A0A7Y9ETV2_9MICO|nr:amidase [Microbacterium pseudoresistens]NYD53823.1 amidase [Microbacterium pseudoresistens]
MAELHELTALEQRDALRRGDVSPRELVAHYLERIRRFDDGHEGGLGAFVEVTGDAALVRAEALGDAEPCGALWGLAFGDKDLVARAGVPTRYGSRLHGLHGLHGGFVPTASDPEALVLDEAGGISLGKTNTPEFGLVGYTESDVAPPARDPWDARNGAGGSSGGAAVAVAAGLVSLAPASDGGGSIRIPAATVGVVGLKPSRGRVAVGSGMTGVGGLAVTGPIARTVADAALLLDALVDGRPYPFATGAPGSGPFLNAATADPGATRVAVTTVSPWDDDVDIALDPDAAAAVQHAAAVLQNDGCAIDDLAWRPRGYASLFGVLWRASAARMTLSAAELALVRPMTAYLVAEGRRLTAPQLLSGLSAAAEFERATIEEFAPFDAVLTPALAEPPQPVGSYDESDPERCFARQVQYAPYSSFVNVAGLPAIVVPVSRTAGGHPVSVQLIGRPGGEATIIALAARLERASGISGFPPGLE